MLKKKIHKNKTLSPRHKEILITYADSDMNKRETARSLFIANSLVDYYFNQILDITGRDPRKFYDLLELLYIVSSKEHVYQEEEVS